ncbi:hypothetical protein DLM77_18635 [Leptospira yasudae]|uniref:Uncharacterized protein n=1 Tax=Leptospira yasudae TaxID=2202201 RepID=A0ABX9LYT3_9LEPT|nr:hypothetical protein DLM77_18635 [Leptospira yasudae]
MVNPFRMETGLGVCAALDDTSGSASERFSAFDGSSSFFSVGVRSVSGGFVSVGDGFVSGLGSVSEKTETKLPNKIERDATNGRTRAFHKEASTADKRTLLKRILSFKKVPRYFSKDSIF